MFNALPLAALVVLLAVASPSAFAQAPPPSAPASESAPASAPASAAPTPASAPASAAPAPDSGPPQTLEAATAQGYASRPADEPAGSLLGGLLAVGPGFLVHGVGHYYVDETNTAWRLLVGEILGVALVASALALQAYTEDARALGTAQRLLMHSGVMLFAGTWVTDILGTFKGAESFDADTSRTQGTAFNLAYNYRADPRDIRNHHLVAGLDLDFGRVYVRPDATLDAALDERDVRLDLGVRVWRGDNRQNQVAVGVRGRRLDYPGEGFAVRSAEGYLRFKADLGQMIRSMRGFYLTHRIGVGLEQYQFASTTGETPSLLDETDFETSFFTLASGAEVNTGRATHLGLVFLQDPTAQIPAASRDTGALQLFLRHRYREDLEIQVDLLAGDGWAVWLGLGYGL